MPAFADVQAHDDSLVRKALGLVVAVAPFATAAITSILDVADGTLKALPVGYEQLGRPTEDGVNWARETELSEIFGHGSANPVRSDIRRSVKRMTVNCLESRKVVLEQYLGADLSSVTTTRVPITTGKAHVTFDEPEIPTYNYVRLIAIARDVTGGGEIYLGRHFLNAKVTEVGETVWSDQDQAEVFPLTFTAYHDSTAGTAVRHFRAGPGYEQIVEDEGFPAPA